MHYIAYIFGVIVILIGIKTVFTQQATINIQLWGNSSGTPQNSGKNGYSTSEHTGFIAVLIGIGQIAIGVGLLLKGPAFLKLINF
jgi:hypothetical protein